MSDQVHWHVFIEIDDGSVNHIRRTRLDRLRSEPADTFSSAEDVAEWIYQMTDDHAYREEIHLVGSPGGIAHTADSQDRGRDFLENLAVLERGDSLQRDFRRKDDRMILIAEAVRPDECREEHPR